PASAYSPIIQIKLNNSKMRVSKSSPAFPANLASPRLPAPICKPKNEKWATSSKAYDQVAGLPAAFGDTQKQKMRPSGRTCFPCFACCLPSSSSTHKLYNLKPIPGRNFCLLPLPLRQNLQIAFDRHAPRIEPQLRQQLWHRSPRGKFPILPVHLHSHRFHDL